MLASYTIRAGIYRYGSGVNYRAIAALAAGIIVALIGVGGAAAALALRLRVVCRIPGGFGHLLDLDAEQGGKTRSGLKRKHSHLSCWCSDV